MLLSISHISFLLFFHLVLLFILLYSASDCSRLRLEAACAVLKLARDSNYADCISQDLFCRMSMVMQVCPLITVLKVTCTLLPIGSTHTCKVLGFLQLVVFAHRHFTSCRW